MQRVLLKKHGIGSAPGDIMVMTAAVESLAIDYPGEYEVGIQTGYHQLWEGNLAVRKIHGLNDPIEGYDRVVEVHYDHIHGSQEKLQPDRDPALLSPGCSFVQAFTWGLGRALGIPLRVRRSLPVAYLTKDDQNWLGRFRQEYGEGPFVVMSPSIKRDTTVKAWPVEYYQKIVDHFRDRVTFLQLGDAVAMGCELNNVVNLVGKTTLRNVLALAYKAVAGIGPITYLLHACAAFETPYFCLAGGREQPSWITYPNVQFFHTMGELPCCRKLACWKSRVVPLAPLPWQTSEWEQLQEKAQNENRCEHPVTGLARPVAQCMFDITPDQVIAVMERHARNWKRQRAPELIAAPEKQAQSWQGLGDVVASATKVFGIEPCGGCEKRRDWLNRLIPFYRQRTPRPFHKRPYLEKYHGLYVRKECWGDKSAVKEMLRDDYGLDSLPKCERVVDVGAHIGSFSLAVLTRWRDAKVVSVEPNRRNLPMLAANTGDLTTIIPAAVCYESAPLLHNGCHAKGNTGGSSLVPEVKEWLGEPFFGATEVPSITLEGILDVMGWDAIDLLKLDCEGGEFDILEHCGCLDRVHRIVGEWHDEERFVALATKMEGWRFDVIRSGGLGLFRLVNSAQIR